MHRRHLIAGLLVLAFTTLPAEAETIQLEKLGSLYAVPVRINGAITVPFIIDSGASSVYLSKEYFTRLRQTGTISQGDFIGTGTWVAADGSRHSDDRYLLHEVIVGNHTVRNVAATVGSGDESLLGQSFLERLPSWTLDNAHHTLVLNDAVSPAPTAPAITAPVISAFGNFGAFAYDDAAHRYGYSWNQGSPSSADAAAIKGCGTDTCKIVFRTGPQECGAIAFGDEGKVWGGAKRDNKSAAELAALDNCQKRFTRQCAVKASECNR